MAVRITQRGCNEEKTFSKQKKRFNFCYFNVHHVAIKIGNKNVCCPPNDANNQCIRNHDNEKCKKKGKRKNSSQLKI